MIDIGPRDEAILVIQIQVFFETEMPRTYTIYRKQILPRSREETFLFFENASNLEKITPGFLRFKIETPPPIRMEKGALIDYRLRLLYVPIRWRTRIEDYDPPYRFVDTQIQGPYRVWRHTHQFEKVAEGTLMTDVVRYQVRFGVLGAIANTIFVKRTLRRIFDFRQRRIEDLLGTNVGDVVSKE